MQPAYAVDDGPFAWEKTRPGDPDVPTRPALLLHAISQRQRWRADYLAAQLAAGEPPGHPFGNRGGGGVSRAAERLTVAEVCAELRIARSTFYEWRAKGRAPRCIKLPNGDLRIRRAELERWLDAHEDAA